MKKLIFLIVSVIILAIPSEAQLVRSRTFGEKEKKGYDRITVGYDAMFLSDNLATLNGVTLNYVHGFKISQSQFFIEIGASASFNIEYTDITKYQLDFYEKFLNVAIRIPLNFSYKLKLSEVFSLYPFLGPYVKINPHSEGFNEDYHRDYNSITPLYSRNTLVQGGVEGGVGFTISNFYFGIQYGFDINPRAKWILREKDEIIKIKTSQLSLNLGVQF